MTGAVDLLLYLPLQYSISSNVVFHNQVGLDIQSLAIHLQLREKTRILISFKQYLLSP